MLNLKLEYKNAVCKEADNLLGVVDCEINHPDFGWIPYTISPEDNDGTVDNEYLINQMAANNDWQAYVAPTQDELNEEAANAIRDEREYILQSEVDPFVSNPLRWADLTEAEKLEVSSYRTALLDITEQPEFPMSVTWPTKPELLTQ